MTPTKTCTKCGAEKEISAFYRHPEKKDGLHSWCKECKNTVDREYHKSPEGRERKREVHLKRKYGISLAEYDEMFDEQNGRCGICGTEDTGSRFKHFTVDHCHDSGAIRGLLCNNCNRGIGLLGDTLKDLSKAVLYLAKNEERTQDELYSIFDGDDDVVGEALSD